MCKHQTLRYESGFIKSDEPDFKVIVEYELFCEECNELVEKETIEYYK